MVSKERCPSCIGGLSDLANDPYLKKLQEIVYLLEQRISIIDKDTTTARLACQAFELLSRLARTYLQCRESRPSQDEMREHVILTADFVENSIQEQYERPTEPHSLSIEASSESSSEKLALRTTLSQGTIDRQLCNIIPASAFNTGYKLSQGYEYNSATNSIGSLSPYSSSSGGIPVTPRSFTAIPLSPESDPGQLASLHSMKSPRDSDTDSVVTDPFCIAPSTADSTILTGFAENNALAYIRGRKTNWDCGFCGPECLCWVFDD
jgi:hypothetical protein